MTDLRADVRAAMAALANPTERHGAGTTSDLSIDETLLLHAMGYAPTGLVSGVSITSIPYGTFITQYGQTTPFELPAATGAVNDAFRHAAERLRGDCAEHQGIGVVGVEVEIEVASRTVTVALTGTAVAPIDGGEPRPGRPFATDLSVRDFALLARTGWVPVDLAVGASFVAAPVQGLRQTLAQAAQNVELPLITQALQTAREQAMDQMQSEALAFDAGGIVDVSIIDGPLGHSRHICAFICYGTAIRLTMEQHQHVEVQLVLPIDDHGGFDASSVV